MNIKMYKGIRRAVYIVICLSVLFQIVSCSISDISDNRYKKKKDTVLSDMPWFEGEVIDVDISDIANRPIIDLFPRLAGADEKYIVVFEDGVYKIEDWSQIRTNADSLMKMLSIIDRSTKQIIKTVDLFSILNPIDLPKAVTYINGNVYVKCDCWDSTTNKYSDREYCIDIENEIIVDYIDYEYVNHMKHTGDFIVGDYRIDCMFVYDGENKHCPIRIYSPDGSTTDVDIADPERDFYEIPVIFTLDDNTALIPVEAKREYYYYKIELDTCKITEIDAREYAWLNIDELQHSYNGSDGKVYFATSKGVSMVDMKNKTVEQVFDYNCCGVSRQFLTDLDIADCSGDTFLLCGLYNPSDMFSSMFVNKYAVVEFTKANKNPHAGKRILELYTPDGEITSTISDATIKFNNSNDKYFIELSDRYNVWSYFDYNDINSSDDYDYARINANVNLCADLAIDLMNGEGPDILLNTSNLGQLNNSNCLVDLSAYITELDSEKFYTNIIDGSKINGKLYQLPISFTIEGIQTDPQYAKKTGIGFTTEEYKCFLYDNLNGKDVIDLSQPLYFTKLYNGMNDRFILDGKANFTDKGFADIADFVKNEVQRSNLSRDSLYSEDRESMDFITKGDKTASYCNCPGISGYLVKRAQIKNGTAILGVPSSDGRGPLFGTDISVAVSAHASNIDACIEFVKILISDDIQNELVMRDKFVLNRDSFKMGCNMAIDYFNTEEGSQNMFDYDIGTYVTSHMKFTSEDIDNLENVIMSCSKMNSPDYAIDAILLEEMPAYFLDQKDLDSVIIIVQDRVQKVLDERG